MSVYLIDYENVKNFKGIEKLSANDSVVIFYSKNADNLSFESHKKILSAKAKIDYKSVSIGGKNALDFQLSSYLGYIISETKKSGEKCYIVSKDKGFEFLVSFWKTELSVSVVLLADLTGISLSEANSAQHSSIKDALKKADLKLEDESIDKIIEIVTQYKTKQTINNNLMKIFKGDQLKGINKAIKPFIKDKN